jgi:hypothetical protein
LRPKGIFFILLEKFKVDDYMKNEDRTLIDDTLYLGTGRLSPITI